MVSFLRREGRRRQFFPALTGADFGPGDGAVGPGPGDVVIARRGGQIAGAGALWDQRALKQTVVRGYGGALRWLRPAYNLGARLLGAPAAPLPAPGSPLRSAYACFLAVVEDDPLVCRAVLHTLLSLAAARGLAYVLLGLAEGDPLLDVGQRFPHVAYGSTLYTVRLAQDEGSSEATLREGPHGAEGLAEVGEARQNRRAPGAGRDRHAVSESVAGEVRTVASLEACERREMLTLLRRYFVGVSPGQFERDLAEKEWVILLRDAASGVTRGFSTLMRLEAVLEGPGEPAGPGGQHVVAFFSGDTVVDRAYWGGTELPRRFARHVFALAAAERRAVPGAAVYWFLICSGYRTYQFLPVFFKEFFPTFRRPTPAGARRILDTLATRKFPTTYDPTTGVIRPRPAARLRPGVAEVGPGRLQNADVAFFVGANPGHAAGDELACLAGCGRST